MTCMLFRGHRPCFGCTLKHVSKHTFPPNAGPSDVMFSSLGSCCDLTTHGTNPSLERHHTSPMPSHPESWLKLMFRVYSALNAHSPTPPSTRSLLFLKHV